MKFSFLHRMLSIVLIIAFLVVGFILVSNIQREFSELETLPENKHVLQFIILFASGLILFILTIFRPTKEIIIEKFAQQEKKEDSKKELEAEQKDEKVASLSERELTKQADELFPKENIDNLEIYAEKLLTNISKKLEIVQGLIFIKDNKDELFKITGKYAYFSENLPTDFKEGESLSGQVAKNKQLINIEDIPEGYVKVISGLGTGSPKNLLIAPAILNEKTVGIIEIASFKVLDKNTENLIQIVANKLVEKINKVTKN